MRVGGKGQNARTFRDPLKIVVWINVCGGSGGLGLGDHSGKFAKKERNHFFKNRTSKRLILINQTIIPPIVIQVSLPPPVPNSQLSSKAPESKNR